MAARLDLSHGSQSVETGSRGLARSLGVKLVLMDPGRQGEGGLETRLPRSWDGRYLIPNESDEDGRGRGSRQMRSSGKLESHCQGSTKFSKQHQQQAWSCALFCYSVSGTARQDFEGSRATLVSLWSGQGELWDWRDVKAKHVHGRTTRMVEGQGTSGGAPTPALDGLEG